MLRPDLIGTLVASYLPVPTGWQGLTDEEWSRVKGFIPGAATGRPRKDPRAALEMIIWVLANQCRWRDAQDAPLPRKVSHLTAWRLYHTLNADKALEGVLRELTGR
jgi:transposase